MAKWHYLTNGTVNGPITEDELLSGNISGVNRGTLVWCLGMNGWLRLADAIPAHDNIPPEAPKPTKENLPTKTAPVWRRTVARLIDLILFSIPSGVLVGIVLGMAGVTSADVRGLIFHLHFSIAFTISWCLADALIVFFSGTTPGRRLIGIELTMSDGGKVPLATLFGRSMTVFVVGLGCGLPYAQHLCVIICLVWTFIKKKAPWDGWLGTCVTMRQR